MLSPMQCFQNAKAYLAAAVSYAHTMFIKLTSLVDFLQRFYERNLQH